MPSFKIIGLPVLEKKIFKRFLPYMGMAAILDNLYKLLFSGMLHVKFDSEWPSGFKEEDV